MKFTTLVLSLDYHTAATILAKIPRLVSGAITDLLGVGIWQFSGSTRQDSYCCGSSRAVE
jgi:hypothetical protein